MPKVPIASAERYAKDIIKALADNGCEIRLTNTYELYVRLSSLTVAMSGCKA